MRTALKIFLTKFESNYLFFLETSDNTLIFFKEQTDHIKRKKNKKNMIKNKSLVHFGQVKKKTNIYGSQVSSFLELSTQI